MRIRKTFAAAFILIALLAAYLGFSKHSFAETNYDKALHFFAFFFLTGCFYWILETTRRRVINITIIVCLVLGGIGSEFVQSMLPYKSFDPYDIVANEAGAGLALLMMQWYHKRMLERRRAAKGRYAPVAPEDDGAHEDLEAGGSELQDIRGGDDEGGTKPVLSPSA